MTIWVSSDFHYNHKNIVGPKISSWHKGYRNFNSISEMNTSIIESINDNVKNKDTLYFLGDWSFGNHSNIEFFRNQIKCENILLCYGNHDQKIQQSRKYQKLFKSCQHYYELKYNGKLFCMSHYSFRVWNKSHRGSFMLYGHSHHTIPNYGRSMDVGWCKWRRPLSIDEIENKLTKIEPIK